MLDLTVIVPIYNVDGYLEECLASIGCALSPTFSAEVICVNDGSLDRSEQIAHEFSDRDCRFRVITQTNGGYGKAINTGLRAANGRFVTIVESDDVVKKNAYASLIELLDRDSALDFVKTPYQPFTADGSRPQMSVPPSGLSAIDLLALEKIPAPATFMSSRLIFEPPAIWAGVYRRSSLTKCGIILPETPGAGYQDTCFSAMCFLNGLTYQWTNDRYYMYRVDREDASRHVRNRRSEIIFLFKFIRENLEKNNNWNDEVKKYYYAVYFRRLIWFMQRVKVEHRFNFFLESYKEFYEVWDEKNLYDSVVNLIPKGEGLKMEKFFNGVYLELYES